MRTACLLAVLAIASLASSPAFAQFGEVWRSPHQGPYHVLSIDDLDGNGTKDFLTGESPTSSGEFIGLRRTDTGALLAQTASRYEYENLVTIDLDGDGPQEILFFEPMTGRQYCVSATPPGPLVPRWNVRPFNMQVPFTMFFANLDGNGHQYVVFETPSATGGKFEVYTNRGDFFGQYQPGVDMGWVPDWSSVQDFDGDGRDEILLAYRDQNGGSPGQVLIMLQSTSPVAVTGAPNALRAVELGSSFPNPATTNTRIEYTVPARGPVSLRLLDVAGREVRTLVSGPVAAGRHQAIWDGRDANGRALPAGAYFYQLNASGQQLGQRVVRLP